MGSRKVHVAAPTWLSGPDRSGAGKMWSRIFEELPAAGVLIRFMDPPGRRWSRRPHAWLTDGHAGPIQTTGRVVAHLHEAPWLEPVEQHLLEPRFLANMHSRSDAAARQAAAIITPSQSSRRQIIDVHKMDPAIVHSIPHGVDRGLFDPSRANAGRELLRKAGWSGPYVACVSTVHPRKNLPVLREAVALLASRGIDVGLALVLSPAGDRHDSSGLLQEAASDLPGYPGRIKAMQELSEIDVAGVLAGATAVCVPSLSEGFGLVALEAMAAGTPVVVSNRGALPEVVGDAGILVEPSAEAVADGLELVIADDQRAAQLSTAGLKRSHDFTWEKSAAAWARVISEVDAT